MAAPAALLEQEDAPPILDPATARACAAEVERAVFREVFRPRERMTHLEWAEQRRYLSPEANAIAAAAGVPVRYSTNLTPYHRDILDALSDPETEFVVCMFPSQDGKTEILNNFIGKSIDVDPGPMLVMQPTKEMAEAWSKDRLAPMVRDSPTLRGKVREARSRDSANTILHKKFPGGHVTVVGSNSAAGLASRPIRDVLIDEVDRCATSAGTEGDPIRLAWRRATTFRGGKKLLISSPTVKGKSRIHKEYVLGTQEELHVPCPHCGEYQYLEWGGTDVAWGLKWAPEKPEEPYYVCRANGCVIEEHHKGWMLERYRWVAQQPEAGKCRRSFWKNAIASNLVAWRKLVAEWREIIHDAATKYEEKQQFVNTVMCELFDPVESEEIDASGLLARLGRGYPADNEAGPGTVPAGVAILTRSVDTQGYGLETAVWGWGEGEEAWLIDWELCEGAPTTPAPWRALDAARAKTYRHASGVTLRPAVTFIDSGGHHTTEVYAYCRARQGQQVFAIKGSNQEAAPLLGRPTRPDSAKTIVYPVGSWGAKFTLMRRLATIGEPGPGYVHLPLWLLPDQVAQFTNEQLVSKVLPGGKRVKVWDNPKGRTEQGHLYNYARAALMKLGGATIRALGQLAARHVEEGAKLAAAAPPPAEAPILAPRATPKRGGFVNRWR